MAQAATAMTGCSEFDAFLFAAVGEEKNGMLLSVLSALARLDIDPWKEAANLAKMPGKVASQKFSALIETLPDLAVTPAASETIAERLIALLPQGAQSARTGSDSWSGLVAFHGLQGVVFFVLINLLAAVVMIGVQGLAGIPHRANEPDHAVISAPAAMPPPESLPRLD